MNLFFDCEFSGLRKNTTLISIGIVAENGKKFYAEFSDYDLEQCDDWITENVIKHLRLSGIPLTSNFKERIQEMQSKGYEVSHMPTTPNFYAMTEFGVRMETDDGTTEVYGDSEWICTQLSKWLSQFQKVQFVSDVCHYNMVLLIDIFGDAFDLPGNVSAVCHDVNQDIARHYGIPDSEAFDKSRKAVVFEIFGKQIDGEKHNALYDAEVIKAIYEAIINC